MNQPDVSPELRAHGSRDFAAGGMEEGQAVYVVAGDDL